MADAHPWQMLVHGGHSSMADACPCVIVQFWKEILHVVHVTKIMWSVIITALVVQLCHKAFCILPRSILHFTTEYFVWLSNRAMMMITNELTHLVMRQLWKELEISGNSYFISITFKHYSWLVIWFPSKLRFVVISYLSALQLTSIPSDNWP